MEEYSYSDRVATTLFGDRVRSVDGKTPQSGFRPTRTTHPPDREPTMKAAYLRNDRYARRDPVGDLPTPEPKAGEVRVKVLAASINPIDTYIRSGAAPMPLPKPAITGTDFAGVVDAVGPGVTRFKPGDRVWGSNQGLLGRQGTCAEFVCVDEEWAYPTPAGVSPTSRPPRAHWSASPHTSGCSTARN